MTLVSYEVKGLVFLVGTVLSDPFTRQEYDKKRMRRIYEHNLVCTIDLLFLLFDLREL